MTSVCRNLCVGLKACWLYLLPLCWSRDNYHFAKMCTYFLKVLIIYSIDYNSSLIGDHWEAVILIDPVLTNEINKAEWWKTRCVKWCCVIVGGKHRGASLTSAAASGTVCHTLQRWASNRGPLGLQPALTRYWWSHTHPRHAIHIALTLPKKQDFTLIPGKSRLIDKWIILKSLAECASA